LNKLISIALEVAKKWGWDKAAVKKLVANLCDYKLAHGMFASGGKDGLKWWEDFPVCAEDYPIKAMAIFFFNIVPHSTEIERLFSDLGGQQTKTWNNLSTETLHALGSLQGYYKHTINNAKAGHRASIGTAIFQWHYLTSHRVSKVVQESAGLEDWGHCVLQGQV
jgi:hypothetical protein